MLRREKRAQLTKNIIAESERVIEFGEHASYSLGSTAGCAFRDRFCRKPCEVVLDRGNLRIKIGDLPRRWESEAANLLSAECPTYRALTPVGRLQAMEQRLDAMLRAVQTVQPALEKFYGSLGDEQKERFNRLSPAQG
jgi:LTXXQ motif family protein